MTLSEWTSELNYRVCENDCNEHNYDDQIIFLRCMIED